MRSTVLLLSLLLLLTAGCSNGGMPTEPTGTGRESGAASRAADDDAETDDDDAETDDDESDDDAESDDDGETDDDSDTSP